MLKFLMWMFRCAGAVLWFAVSFIVFLEEDSEPAYESFADWVEDDGISLQSGSNIGRTCLGSVEPAMTSTWGETMGRISGARINS